MVKRQIQSRFKSSSFALDKSVPVEFEAAIQIPHIHIDGVDAQVGVLLVGADVYASGLRHLKPGNRRKSWSDEQSSA
jgi:hypothetical protein